MTCKEFQQVLPDLLEGQAGGESTAPLQSCHACAELVADLRAICDEAQHLSLAEPSDRVWANIQRTLEAEGLVRTPMQAGGILFQPSRQWAPFKWLAPISAGLALAAGGFCSTQSPAATGRSQPARLAVLP